MRSFVPGIQKTFKAGADLSADAKRYTFVAMSADQTVNTAGAGAAAIGVQQNQPASGKSCVVMITGTSKVLVDGGTAIAAGDKLKTDASGRGIKNTAGTNCVGIALEAAAAANLVIEVLLTPGGATPA